MFTSDFEKKVRKSLPLGIAKSGCTVYFVKSCGFGDLTIVIHQLIFLVVNEKDAQMLKLSFVINAFKWKSPKSPFGG